MNSSPYPPYIPLLAGACVALPVGVFLVCEIRPDPFFWGRLALATGFLGGGMICFLWSAVLQAREYLTKSAGSKTDQQLMEPGDGTGATGSMVITLVRFASAAEGRPLCKPSGDGASPSVGSNSEAGFEDFEEWNPDGPRSYASCGSWSSDYAPPGSGRPKTFAQIYGYSREAGERLSDFV